MTHVEEDEGATVPPGQGPTRSLGRPYHGNCRVTATILSGDSGDPPGQSTMFCLHEAKVLTRPILRTTKELK